VPKGEIPLDEEKARDNRIVAGWLLHYHERKREYEQKREEILHSLPPALPDTPSGSRNQIGDPTGRKGQKLADLRETEEWLALVEEVERRLPWKLRLVLQFRREATARRGRIGTGRYRGRPAWIPYVQHKYCEAVAKRAKKQQEDVWIESPSVFSEWWGRILDYAARLAAKKGLLNREEDRRIENGSTQEHRLQQVSSAR